MKKQSKLKVGSLVAICRPDNIYYCRVEKVLKNDKPMGFSFDYIAIDECQERLGKVSGRE
jgi:hypothetical protein